jgi:hypothetical protein
MFNFINLCFTCEKVVLIFYIEKNKKTLLILNINRKIKKLF